MVADNARKPLGLRSHLNTVVGLFALRVLLAYFCCSVQQMASDEEGREFCRLVSWIMKRKAEIVWNIERDVHIHYCTRFIFLLGLCSL
jgi:hypothetical protein